MAKPGGGGAEPLRHRHGGELDLVASLLAEQGVACAPCNGWAEGGKGTPELAKLVCEAADANPAPVPSYTYPDEAPLKTRSARWPRASITRGM